MMNPKQKSKYMGLVGALFVHLALLLLLLFVSFSVPKPEEEGGVSVMLGEMSDAFGASDPTLVKVDVMPQQQPTPPVEEVVEQDMITQETEETVAIPPKTTPRPKKEEVKKTEKSAEEIAVEKQRLEAEKAERERKAAEEAARRRVANAFGRGAQMGNKGTTDGEGVQGSPTGNAAAGMPTGVGGYGSFNLDGRSLGPGGLPKPVYNVQEEGRVVVTIIVNPRGEVISTAINRQTNTVNTALRRAAEEAAKKARFNSVNGLDNQQGTITYYFNLK